MSEYFIIVVTSYSTNCCFPRRSLKWICMRLFNLCLSVCVRTMDAALDFNLFSFNHTNENGTDDLTSILQDLQGSLTGKPNLSSFWSAILTISYAVVICMGIAENLIVLFAIFYHKQLLNTTHNLLIATLALSDLLLCGITLPTNIWELLNRQWPFGANSKTLCQLFKAAEKFPLFLSATAIIAIAWDRYRGIVASNPR